MNDRMETRAASRTRLEYVFERFMSGRPFVRLSHMLEQSQPGIPCVVTGLAGSSTAVLIRSLAATGKSPILVVTQRSEEAGDLYEDLLFLLGPERVGHYPSRQILPYDFRAPVGEIMGKRISTLAALRAGDLDVVVTPVRALMEPTIPPENLASAMIDLKAGDEQDIDSLVDKLVSLGFHRVPLVEEVGDFARRGGLVDFFTPGAEAPVRIEFFGDEIETIRHFDVGTQRTVDSQKRITLLPRREIPITQETLEQYLAEMPEDDGDYIRRRYVNDPELPGLEWLALLFGIPQGRLSDYLPRDTVVIFDGHGTIGEEADSILAEAGSLRERLAGRLQRLPDPDQYYVTRSLLFDRLDQFRQIDRVPFKGGRGEIVSFDCREHPALGSRLDLLGETIREYESAGITYFIATDSEGQAARLDELIAEKAKLDTRPPIEVADLKGGFVCPSDGYAILTDHQIFSRYHRRVRRKKFKEGVAIADYSSLNHGDYVVHTDHGIARYIKLETLTVDGRNRDCLLLQYAEQDKLYVPIEEFNRVSKYAGKDSAPALTRLGGPGWDKLKARTKKAVADMAADLIKLYAERKSQPGFAFGPDTTWLKQLEASFPFEETRDQTRAIADVKRDMEKDQPTDRLICGDVGYGKTEVAVRAAFKAVDAGKQVAVLVPTTILAQQHYATFRERLAEFPVRTEVLSRFRTRAEQLATVDGLAAGTVDLVIGTHRLLSADVHFRDLGLLIIDEEHRFGVRHKEKLRRLKASVDTIAMTATPIPRTLQMSLMGARDMSIINTSPKDRLPIITEIVEFDPAVIATGILREIDRGGQVFFVHNRVQTIEAMHRYLKKLLPQVQFAVAHGQMHEKSLEGIMLGFMAKRYDVLICTSIIESGLDIPSANTIIINRADRFGLAQLYQIRGRVGRSSRRAYAYLMTPPTRLMNADAIKRLRALEAHSDLGAGFALAMRDLEIRGAGTILGARQSGFIEEVGYDLYNRLLEEAVAELRGQPLQRLPETRIELDVELFLPGNYVNDNQQKVDIYRRVADCRNLDELERLRDEITDRFGKLPPSAVNLFDAAGVKICASMMGLEKVTMRAGRVNLFYEEQHRLSRAEVESLRKATDQPMEFSMLGHPRITLDLGQINHLQRLGYLRGVLSKAI
ncbi:MAG: transcription-repair coupling factor [candidate division Zixibacteria bacterium]|jgi:transcription-repair coupling factor (superfamily II helicase)|nr:transcription-repair coupling factor [candidate division Zixibacteria bacterium]